MENRGYRICFEVDLLSGGGVGSGGNREEVERYGRFFKILVFFFRW